jgi:hypothetical protein
MKLDGTTTLTKRFPFLLGGAMLLAIGGAAGLALAAPSESNGGAQQGITGNDSVEKQTDEYRRLCTWPQQLEASVQNGKFATEVIIHPKNVALPKGDAKHFVGTMTDTIDPSGTYFIVESRADKSKTEVKFFTTEETKYSEMGKDGKEKKLEARDLSGREIVGRPVVITYYQGKSFGDKFTRAEYDAFVKYYDTQLPAALRDAGPVNVLGEPIVQFRYVKSAGAAGPGSAPGAKMPKFKGKGPIPKVEEKVDPDDEVDRAKYLVGDTWIYDANVFDDTNLDARAKWQRSKPPPDNRFFSYVPNWNFKQSFADDIAEEIWIAQENLWVQRELFKRIKLANDNLAAFVPTVSAKQQGDGRTKPVKLKNYYWEIELKGAAGDDTIEITLHNLRPVLQELPKQRFLLHVERSDGQKTKVEKVLFPPKNVCFAGAPVGPHGIQDKIKDTAVQSIKLKEGTRLEGKIVGAEQVLTWETAAVKRIDVVAIGGLPTRGAVVSHRLSDKLLVPYKKRDGKNDDAALKEVPGPKKFLGKGAKEAPLEFTLTTHGFVRERYLEVTPQIRKLPVCLMLIIAPELINHVEAVFVDSPLRFLTTQVLWNRYSDSLQPPTSMVQGDGPGPGFAGNGPAISPMDTETVALGIYGVVTLPNHPGAVEIAPVAQAERSNWFQLNNFIYEGLPRTDGKRLLDITPDGFHPYEAYFKKAPPEAGAISGELAWQRYKALRLQAAAGKPLDFGQKLEERKAREYLVQVNIEGITALYSDNLPAEFFSKLMDSKLEGMRRDQAEAVRDVNAKRGPASTLPKAGWVVEIRGYTYHTETWNFVMNTLVANLADLADINSVKGQRLKKALPSQPADPVKFPPDMERILKVKIWEGDKAVDKPRISHVFLYDYLTSKRPQGGGFTLIGTSNMAKLLLKGSHRGGWTPPRDTVFAEVFGPAVAQPKLPGGPGAMAVPGRLPMRTEFIVVFVWQEPLGG